MYTCVSSVTMKRASPVDLLLLLPSLMDETDWGKQSIPQQGKPDWVHSLEPNSLLEAYLEHPNTVNLQTRECGWLFVEISD